MEKNQRKNVSIFEYIYIWITLLYIWNLYSFVIQLYFNKKFFKNIKKQSIEKEELIIFLMN